VWVALTACGASFAAARPAKDGVLVLGGGAQAIIRVDRTTCVAGPGNAVAVYVTSAGGWGSLYLNASVPRAGRHGDTRVFLQGTGYRSDSDAVDYWGWSAKSAKAVSARGPVRITANGATGLIETTLPVVGNDNAPPSKPVKVVLRWAAGMCVKTP